MDSTTSANRAQRTWQRFCRFAVNVFYRRAEISGLEHLPESGGVVLCANHANALVDALIVQASCPRPIHPLARSGLFRKPLLGRLLRGIRAVPIYRKNPQQKQAGRNQDSFRKCFELLSQGGVLLIFPEGQSHSDPSLRPLKTGAARLLQGTEEAHGVRPQVVPVGLTFTHKGRFRSRVLVQYGPPVDLPTEDGEDPEDTVRRHTDLIEKGLEGVTLNVDSWEDLALLRMLQRFFALRREGKIRQGRGRGTMTQRFRSLQQLIDAHRWLRFSRPDLVRVLSDRLRRFEALCRQHGIRDYHLNIHYRPAVVARFLLHALGFTLFVMPPALWGLLNSALPYLATRAAARRMAHGRDQYDTASVTAGFVLFLLFWGAQTFAVFWFLGTWPAAAYAASLPLTSALALKIAKERQRIQENIRVFLLFSRRRHLQDYLRLKRQELEVDLARLTRIARQALAKEGWEGTPPAENRTISGSTSAPASGP